MGLVYKCYKLPLEKMYLAQNKITGDSHCTSPRISEKMVRALDCVGQRFMLHSTVHKWGSRQRKSQMWLILQNPNTEEKRLGA